MNLTMNMNMNITMEQRRSKALRALRGGLIPAVPVPRTADGRIHARAQEDYAAYLSAQNIAGVAVWVHTGRGLYLTEEERRHLLHSWSLHLRKDQLLIAGAGALPDPLLSGEQQIEEWRQDSLAMAAEAKAGGAEALLVFPPVIFRQLEPAERDAATIAYHREMASMELPLILFYLYEDAGGLNYSESVLKELLAIPSVIGIKSAALDSVMTLQQLSRLVTGEFSDRLLLTGEDRMFGYSLMCGASGALVGLGAAYPNIQSDLIRAYGEHDYARFMDLSSRVDAYAMATFTRPMDKYILRMLWCLAIEGVIPEEAANDLWSGTNARWEMEEGEIALLRETIRQWGLY